MSVHSRLKKPEISSKQTVKDGFVKSVNVEVTSHEWSNQTPATSASAGMPCVRVWRHSARRLRARRFDAVEDVFWSTHKCFDTVSI